MSYLPDGMVPTPEEIQRLRLVANGTESADLIVRNAMALAVHTGESLPRDIVIAGRHIAAVTPVGRFEATETVDAQGLHAVPNFIDTHIHIEYTMLTPGELARLIVPKGTTTLLADPNCIANVLGARGMDLDRRNDELREPEPRALRHERRRHRPRRARRYGDRRWLRRCRRWAGAGDVPAADCRHHERPAMGDRAAVIGRRQRGGDRFSAARPTHRS